MLGYWSVSIRQIIQNPSARWQTGAGPFCWLVLCLASLEALATTNSTAERRTTTHRNSEHGTQDTRLSNTHTTSTFSSSPPTSNMSFAETPGMHLQHLIQDTKATATKEQKVACLKTLRIVVKNLADPLKSADPKYRQLKLSNEKVKEKIKPCPSALEYMKAIGFMVHVETEEDGAEVQYLRIDSAIISIPQMEASLAELNNAIDMLVPKAKESSFSRQGSSLSTASSSSSSTGTGSTRMLEKQKARLLMEAKRKRELQEAKIARKKTADLIKQGKNIIIFYYSIIVSHMLM